MTLRNEHDQFRGGNYSGNGDGSGVGEDFKAVPNQKRLSLMITIFDGEDAFGWTSRVERYFELKGVGDNEKIQAAMIAQYPTWEDLKEAIIQRFQPSILQSPYELLPSLKQTGTVEEYREQRWGKS
jgi:hypothetical protein